jgi:hypothetical protein
MQRLIQGLLIVAFAAVILAILYFGNVIYSYGNHGALATTILGVMVLMFMIMSAVSMVPAWHTLLRPLIVTTFTYSLYLTAGQYTYAWANHLFGFGENSSFGDVVNLGILILFVRAAMHAPSGELKKAEIGRVELFGSPLPEFFNLVLSQGNGTVPHGFGWEVLNRRLPYFMAVSLKMNNNSECTMGISIWFRQRVPGRFDEFDLEKQIIPGITRLFEPALRQWAVGLAPDQFTGGQPLPHGQTPIEAAEEIIVDSILDPNGNGPEILDEFGIDYDAIACTDPKRSPSADKAGNLRTIIGTLTANNGIPLDKAINIALVMSGDAQLVMLGNLGGGKGGGKGGNVVFDDDDSKGRGGKGGKDGKADTKKDEKKLSDPPKAKKGGYKIILVIELILLLFQFAGWGVNEKRIAGKTYPSDVLPKIPDAVEHAVAGAFPQPARTLPRFVTLVDNGEGKWITAPATDMEGWLDVSLFPDNPLHNEGCYIRFANSPDTDEILVEKELKDGSVIQYASKGADWIMKARGHDQMSVKPLDVGDKAKKIRIKLINPEARLGLGPLQIEVERR